jgi:iron complex transport system permease protein
MADHGSLRNVWYRTPPASPAGNDRATAIQEELRRPAPMTLGEPQVTARRAAGRVAGLAVTATALAVVVVLSIAVGSRSLSLAEVWQALVAPTGSDTDSVVRDLRLPRTLLGLLAGVALGLAGAVMQALTRNPLADPGLLGVNQGAAAAIVLGITVAGVRSPGALAWWAFGGALITTALVYGVGAGRTGASAARLLLAGVAIQYVLVGLNQAMQLANSTALDRMRFWVVGSLANREPAQLLTFGPAIAAGAVLALALARGLNAMALGDDTARALGAHTGRIRALALIAVTMLCGAATAACGPMAFVGLLVPQMVRGLVGADQRWVLPLSALAAPVLLLGADVVGRVLARPAELQVGIVTDVIGGIVFIALIRRRGSRA